MSERNIAVIRLSEACAQDGKDAVLLAKYFSDNGADEIVVFDLSKTDEEHDRHIGLLKEICRNVEVPVKAGGHINRVEDVKKILYAGCSKAILNFSRQENIDLTEEVSKRFGKKKIAAAVDSSDIVSAPADLVDEYVSEIIYMDDLGPFIEKIRPISSDMEWSEFKLNEDGLLPVVVQDYRTDEVLMVAYMNEEAFQQTCQTGRMTYYSRSRQSLWLKGETSGHYQYVRSLSADCDWDTLLAKVEQVGVACHTGAYSCFFRPILEDGGNENCSAQVFENLERVIADRKANPKEGSYTNYLFDKGIDKILKKVGEEATEIVIAAKNPDPEEIKYEVADFLYHVMVLLAERGVAWQDIVDELARR